MKKKVLFLIDSLPGGGAEKVLVDIVENLNKDKFDIRVMTTLAGGVHVDNIKKNVKYKPFFEDLKDPDSRLEKFIYRFKGKFRYLFYKYVPCWLMHKIFIGNKYDIEIAFLEGHATKIIGSSTNKYSKKLAWVHTDLIANNWPIQYYNNLEEQVCLYHKFDEIYCVSNQVKQSFEQLTNRTENVFTFYNPVNENKIRNLSLEKMEFEFDKSILNVITVGRLTHQKGYDRLLNIHKRLIEEGFKYHLYILGEGEERIHFEKFIEDNSLQNTVTLLGFQKNPYKYMKQADLFICSSRAEGFSTVATEATILGIPIITTDCSGMNELLGHSKYGLITENDEASLYNGFKKIITDKGLYNYYKEACVKRSNDFKLFRTIRMLEEIINA